MELNVSRALTTEIIDISSENDHTIIAVSGLKWEGICKSWSKESYWKYAIS